MRRSSRRAATPVGFLLIAALAACGDAAQGESAASDTAFPDAERIAVSEVVQVFKSPTCGCCEAWTEHLVAAGFEVEVHDTDDLVAIKVANGVKPQHQSCHTALVDGYVIEGHVPADLVRRLLDERPDIAGLAVPGMPIGSPGMEVPSGRRDAYDVIAFQADGTSSVYASR